MGYDNLMSQFTSLNNDYRKEVDRQIAEKGFANVQELQQKLNNTYSKICEASSKESIYFIGATLELYKNNLEKFIKKAEQENSDFSTYEGLKKEYNTQNNWHYSAPKEIRLLDEEIQKKFKTIINKRLEFLQIKMFEMGIDVVKTFDPQLNRTNVSFKDNLERRFLYEKQQPSSKNISYSIKWNGINTELAELIKALIESNKLETGLTQSEIFKRFSLFFNYEINETTGIKDFSKRKNTGGNLTKFLDTLKDNLENWYITKEEKKRNSR